ncbi:MAG TPA: site-2 protease family protein [Nitrososphaerales archaeon]|nr:site-2 protease family protein [Nitrososphaerales archaeon]
MPITVGKIYGIPILLDYSWFIIFILIAYTVGFGLMPSTYPGLGWPDYVAIGVLSSVLLFGSVLVHELAHSILAKRNGLKIKQISLFIFGGVSEIEEEASNPSVELKVSAAGPITSILIAALAYGAWYLSVILHLTPLVRAPVEYTALVNEIVAAFNLIPAFPMDGGRILRSLLWYRNKDLLKSTRTASRVGNAIAYIMIFGGIFFVFFADPITGIWLVLIGWYISSAARGAMTATVIQKDLQMMKANQVMTRTIDSVSPDISLEELSQEIFRTKHNGFPVLSGQELVGCVTNEDLRKVKREQWPTTRVADIMVPREKLVTMHSDELSDRAFTLMNQNRIGRIFVLDNSGRLVGIITRSDIIKVVQMQESLHEVRGRESSIGADGSVVTVQQGMLFVLERPVQAGSEWKAVYDPSVFNLIGRRIVQPTPESQVEQFTFEAMKRGSYAIEFSAQQMGVGTTQKKGAALLNVIKYNIIVN